ncbi:HVO_A0114 family putative DNA-binding protein [Halobacterium noricense]|uniref:HVO_A0114 family putative DNA-binding protein n=1 Tax=Halobacterium noricense TaxID=223182 RepID=UPI001E62FA6F|nr:transcriptional regulator [Halobacterium noricense]UHH25554.1 transcriptional regulator [Halobacterium noricense]
MPDEPTDTEPTHDEFTPGPEEVDYPSTLRITALPAEQAQAAALERAEQWEHGEEVPHVVNFEDRAQLRELLTDRRMELLEEVMERPPESIRALADRLDRDVHDVHDDLHLLADYDIVHFKEAGRAKKPYVPYDTVRLEVEFGLSRDGGAESQASA